MGNISDYEIVADIALANHALFAGTEHEKMVIGLLAEALHRIKPANQNKMISTKANELPASKRCKEHYFGRKASADLIFYQIDKGVSKERLIAIIKSRSRVHLTTSQENMLLRNYSHLHWREAYRQADIQLIPYHRNKYVYIVDGIEYNDMNEVTKKFNISNAAAAARFTSQAKKGKYQGWKRYEREYENPTTSGRSSDQERQRLSKSSVQSTSSYVLPAWMRNDPGHNVGQDSAYAISS